MNILCKLFGHRIYFDNANVCGGSHCARRGCDHREPGIRWERVVPPMLKCKVTPERIIDLDVAKLTVSRILERINEQDRE